MTDQFDARPEDRFTFGLWTVGNPGADPFGSRVRETIPPTRIVQKLGAHGVNLHDNDLVRFEATAAKRDANDPKVRAFALAKTMRAMDVGAEFGEKTYVGVQ